MRDAHAGIDRAYHSKYDRYGPQIVGSVVGPQVAPLTRQRLVNRFDMNLPANQRKLEAADARRHPQPGRQRLGQPVPAAGRPSPLTHSAVTAGWLPYGGNHRSELMSGPTKSPGASVLC